MAEDVAKALQVLVDDFYFTSLSVASDDGGEKEIFPISDEKYAQQLCIQEALMSSVSRNNYPKSEVGESSSVSVNASVEVDRFCEICMDTKPKTETRNTTKKCSHIYCSECITKHITAKIQENNNTQITCPEFNCKEMLQPHLCRDIIPGELFDRWEKNLCESLILSSQKIYCPFKDCSVMLVNDGDGVIIRETECPHCRRLFCAQCKVPWHSDLDCNGYQEIKSGGKEDMILFNLAEKKKWRRCPSCRFYVERRDGCPHIVCRCGSQFCYTCGAKWSETHICDRI